MRASLPRCCTGSSPHLRGNLGGQPLGQRLRRVIPAPAGEPRSGAPRRSLSEGHPRTCGGTMRDTGGDVNARGSSPHLRGNLLADEIKIQSPGVIPAPAGEPRTRDTGTPLREGHPRTCGGTSNLVELTEDARGSSPHLRGNRGTVSMETTILRVIPAPAGEPGGESASARCHGGHPRTCGGTQVKGLERTSTTGSSPHLRGNHPSREPGIRPARVIPAPAGEPTTENQKSLTCPGHPRTCGGT